MALELVQPIKTESTALGGGQDDTYYVPVDAQVDVLETAGIVINDATHRDESTRIQRAGADMTFADGHNPSPVTLTQLLSAGSGITEALHESLPTLVHEIDAPSYEEYAYDGSYVTGCIIWTDSGKTRKIREEQYVYTSSHRVSQVTTIQYDSGGIEKMRMVEAYTYANSRVSYVQRTKSGSP